jgi:hypothetical protein
MDDEAEPAALDACGTIAMQRGTFANVTADKASAAAAETGPPSGRAVGVHERFDVHAGVRIAAGDALGRERLCRYGARPALALDRLLRLRDGRIAYRVKYARRGRAKCRLMTPTECLARLAALVPPPRLPLVRYHGVLGPNSPWRKDVVPAPPARPSARPRGASRPCRSSEEPSRRHRCGRGEPDPSDVVGAPAHVSVACDGGERIGYHARRRVANRHIGHCVARCAGRARRSDGALCVRARARAVDLSHRLGDASPSHIRG